METLSMASPFVKPPAKISTSICLRKDHLDRLKKIKAKEKIPVSLIIEQIIDMHFEKENKLNK